MSMEKLVARAKNILLLPRTEWPVITAEPDTVGGLYTRYILPVSALPAVAGFIKATVLGTGVPMMGTIRVGVVTGLTSAALQYGIGLVSVYVLALIINALAPTFGGQKDPVQALKTAAYASTAAWIAGVLILVPWLGPLLALLGSLYSFYLLYVGLPLTMRSAPDKATPYTVVTVICAVVLSLLFGALMANIAGIGAYRNGVELSSEGSTVKVDPDSALGKLEALSKKMEVAGKKMEQAEQSGDQQAQIKAAGAALGTLFSGGDTVEALKPEELKAFVPEKLDGLPRSDYSAERNTVMGLQTAEARARYNDESGARSLNLEITDLGSTKGLAALAGWAVHEVESESDRGYERSYHKDGRMVHEKWDATSRSGSYTQIIGERFSVELQGRDVDMDELKKLSDSLDLSALEKLRNSGVKPAEG
jgi:hypothetical protein